MTDSTSVVTAESSYGMLSSGSRAYGPLSHNALYHIKPNVDTATDDAGSEEV